MNEVAITRKGGRDGDVEEVERMKYEGVFFFICRCH
jgi:hypothetical protein